MIELLKLCGFQEQELDGQLPRVEKAFSRLGITAEDLEKGEKRLKKYYAVELEGIRKVIRLCVLDLVNAMLLKEEGKKKIIYGIMAPGFETISSALVCESDEVYSMHQSWSFLFVVGCIFGKLVPVLEAAEERWLKPGAVAHCGNVKTFLGQIALNLIDRPDLIATSGLMCETAPKTLDLIHEIYGIPIACYDACHDRELHTYTDATRRMVHMAAKSMRRLGERIHEVVGFEITHEMLWNAIEAKAGLQEAVGKIRTLIEKSDPLPLSPTHDNLWMCLTSLTFSPDNMPKAISALDILYEELLQRVSEGQGVVEKGAPRILAMCPAHHADPRLEHLITELGIALVAGDTGFMVPYEEMSQDPYEAISIFLTSSLFTGLAKRIPMFVKGCKELNIDGVLNRFHVGCRMVTGDAFLLGESIKDEVGIPVLTLEWENFDPRVYNHEDYRRRLEIFKEMMI
jgi:benzoyl-CoA reductase/2-hydroxyglutaryl-CoA dehydratase subunit BcrC/BadD/HgdB